MTAAARSPDFADRMPERELQQLVTDLCGWLGLLHFHTLNSKGMTKGWPDSVIIGQRILFRELKTQTGRLSPEQREVGNRLQAAGADWKVWRPSDWLSGAIETELRLLKGHPVLFAASWGPRKAQPLTGG